MASLLGVHFQFPPILLRFILRTDIIHLFCFLFGVLLGLDCKKAVPGVYANVATVRDWIDGQIGVIGLDRSYYTYRGN